MYYTFSGISNGQYKYHVTYKLFMVCHTTRQFPNPALISIFDRRTGARIRDLNVVLSRKELIQLTDVNPCITNPPEVCSQVGYYDFDVSLPASANGYLIVSQVIFRVDGIS